MVPTQLVQIIFSDIRQYRKQYNNTMAIRCAKGDCLLTRQQKKDMKEIKVTTNNHEISLLTSVIDMINLVFYFKECFRT